ncbi:hypothetical protein BC828DRAFT_409872, partial [Blastocladiella britannica]
MLADPQLQLATGNSPTTASATTAPLARLCHLLADVQTRSPDINNANKPLSASVGSLLAIAQAPSELLSRTKLMGSAPLMADDIPVPSLSPPRHHHMTASAPGLAQLGKGAAGAVSATALLVVADSHPAFTTGDGSLRPHTTDELPDPSKRNALLPSSTGPGSARKEDSFSGPSTYSLAVAARYSGKRTSLSPVPNTSADPAAATAAAAAATRPRSPIKSPPRGPTRPSSASVLSRPAVADGTVVTMQFANGAKYHGPLVGGEMHGDRGEFVWQGSGTKYVGPFVQNRAHGSGELSWSDGSRYTGDIRGNVRCGDGELALSSGVTYRGQWLDGRPHGK